MDCNVVKDLIPLYIDGCCSEESAIIVEEHLKECSVCREIYEDMKNAPDVITVAQGAIKTNKINSLKASVIQSVSLFLSFILVIIGVGAESKTPSGLFNGFWALNLVVPATGFMLSLANWYFIKTYKNKRAFSAGALVSTLGIIACGYLWAGFHYEFYSSGVLQGMFSGGIFDGLYRLFAFAGVGIVLSAVLSVLSWKLSGKYAGLLGKE